MQKRKLLFVLFATAAVCPAASVLPYSQLVVFGDSLSDTGNLYARDLHLYPTTPNYAAGKFTDSAGTNPASSIPYPGVWHEDLSYLLGIPVAGPSLSGSTDYAYGGAVTGFGTSNFGLSDNMGQQVFSYLGSRGNTASSTSLYAFWGGANDLLNAAEATGATAASVMAAESAAIQNLTFQILTLGLDGAKHFLWLDLPDLSATPRAQGLPANIRTALGQASQQFQLQFSALLNFIPAVVPGVDVQGVDVYGLLQYVTNNPAPWGLSNTTTPAQGTGVNPDTYLFWDDLHPTTTGHAIIALYTNQLLQAANRSGSVEGTFNSAFARSALATDAFSPSVASTPEPATFLIGGLSLAFIAVGARRGKPGAPRR